MEDDHLTQLRAVFERFQEHGLKLSKCNFFCTEINYLGHKVFTEGMQLGTEGLKGITKIRPLATYMEVRKFVGATGFFHRFIKILC